MLLLWIIGWIGETREESIHTLDNVLTAETISKDSDGNVPEDIL